MNMVNLLATITTKVIFLWTTVSTTTPVVGGGSQIASGPSISTYAVYRPVMCNQFGTEYELTLATLDWKGVKTEVEIERKPTGKTENRSVDCNSVGSFFRRAP